MFIRSTPELVYAIVRAEHLTELCKLRSPNRVLRVQRRYIQRRRRRATYRPSAGVRMTYSVNDVTNNAADRTTDVVPVGRMNGCPYYAVARFVSRLFSVYHRYICLAQLASCRFTVSEAFRYVQGHKRRLMVSQVLNLSNAPNGKQSSISLDIIITSA
jgi:hypothetical protein